MKCPYREFSDCIVEQCPSCIYETIEKICIEGRYPAHLSTERAIEEGYAWEVKKKTYKFVSCKLVESGVQPIPAQKISNTTTTKTNVLVKKSIF
jgi:hypothetical protein